MNIELVPLQENEKERFIKEIQAAFKKAVVEEFGDNGEEIIPREDVINSFNAAGAESYNIICNGEIVGGAVLKINPVTKINELQLLYIKLGNHSKGLGAAAWQAIEKLHPETKIWETFTPYFEKRNIHFYVNRCGFKIIEFYGPQHPLPCPPNPANTPPDMEYFFRFEKDMTAAQQNI